MVTNGNGEKQQPSLLQHTSHRLHSNQVSRGVDGIAIATQSVMVEAACEEIISESAQNLAVAQPPRYRESRVKLRGQSEEGRCACGDVWVGVGEAVVLHHSHRGCSQGQQQALVPRVGRAKHHLLLWRCSCEVWPAN